jgi:hypothetical protein
MTPVGRALVGRNSSFATLLARNFRSAMAAKTLAVFVLVLAAAGPARAQSPPPRVELTGTVLLTGGVDFGTQKATLTGNDPGNPDFTLFSTTTTLGTGAGPEARLGIRLTRALAVEVAFSWTRQTLDAHITGDAENAPDTTATQPLSTIAIGGDALVRLSSMAFGGGKGTPFVIAGGGFFRQTDDHQLQLGSGAYVEAGVGAKYVVSQRAGGFPRLLAIRGDGRLVVRSNAFDPTGATSHTTWAMTAGMTAGF